LIGLLAGCHDCDVIAPLEYESIQDSIDRAGDGDVVCVDKGHYTENLDFGGRAIHLLGLHGPAETVVDGDHAGPVVTFDDGEGADAVLEGFTLTDGRDNQGAGVYVTNASPTLVDLWITGNEGSGIGVHEGHVTARDSWINENEASGGAGVSVWRGSVDLQACSIQGNHAQSYGGGVELFLSEASLSDVYLSENEVWRQDGITHHYGLGGGLYASQSTCTVVGGVFHGNDWIDEGGAAYIAGSEVRFERTIVTDHLSLYDGAGLRIVESEVELDGVELSYGTSRSGDGGGIAAEESILRMDNVLVHGNEAATGGGAVLRHVNGSFDHVRIEANKANEGHGGGMVMEDSSPSLTNVILVGNEAEEGAGMFLDGASPILHNVTLAGNLAHGRGGGVYARDSDPVITNTIFGGNWAMQGAEIHAEDHGFELRYSDVWSTGYATWGEGFTSVAVARVEPLFEERSTADPAHWDLHLTLESPLVDRGDPGLVDPDGTRSDMGAYGGPGAGGWDLDRDGFTEWWQPGGRAAAGSRTGLDCLDRGPGSPTTIECNSCGCRAGGRNSRIGPPAIMALVVLLSLRRRVRRDHGASSSRCAPR